MSRYGTAPTSERIRSAQPARAWASAIAIITASASPTRVFILVRPHTNGMESFWSMLKRWYQGTYHHFSEKHLLRRYVSEFAGRHNTRPADTLDQKAATVAGMIGKRLRYRDLVA